MVILPFLQKNLTCFLSFTEVSLVEWLGKHPGNSKVVVMTDCSRAANDLVFLIQGEGSKKKKSNQWMPVIAVLLLMHLAKAAEMGRGLMERPHTPKHHRPSHRQQQDAQHWWRGQRTHICVLCFQAEKKNLL